MTHINLPVHAEPVSPGLYRVACSIIDFMTEIPAPDGGEAIKRAAVPIAMRLAAVLNHA